MKSLLLSSLIAAAAASPAFAFDLTSPDVSEGGTLKMEQVANVFGCAGGNVSPALAWHDVPKGTKSFVVTMFDPDAPTGSGFWHWVVFDIPGNAAGLARGAGSEGGRLPEGAIQSKADAGVPHFVGACPPAGPAHHYVITVRALKVDKLGLDANASGALVGFMSKANMLGEAKITATYGQ